MFAVRSRSQLLPPFVRFIQGKTNLSQLRKGQVILFQSRPQLVLGKSQHFTGRGGSIIKIELKDLVNNKKSLERCNVNDNFEVLQLQSEKWQVLYWDQDLVHLFNPTTMEQSSLGLELLEGDKAFLKEGMELSVQSMTNPPTVISLKLPDAEIFEIEHDEPAAAQASKGVTYKAAFVCGGNLRIMVPDFVKVGEKVVVDLNEKKYLRRA